MKGREGGLDSTYIEFYAEFQQRFDPVRTAAEDANGGESLDVMLAAEQALHCTVHLGQFDTPIFQREFDQHDLRRRVPHGAQPPAPRAPGGVKIHLDTGKLVPDGAFRLVVMWCVEKERMAAYYKS